jgi:hypothetical protein
VLNERGDLPLFARWDAQSQSFSELGAGVMQQQRRRASRTVSGAVPLVLNRRCVRSIFCFSAACSIT